MPRSQTASFVATLPLKTSSSDEKELEARFKAAQNLYNAVLSESKKRLELVRNSAAYTEAKATPRKDKKLRSERFKAARNAYRYSEYDLHEFAHKKDDHLIMSSVLSDWGRLETTLRQA